MKDFLIFFFGASGLIFWFILIYNFILFIFKAKIDNRDFEDISYCDKCHRDTVHLYHDSGHERDSSGSWKMCLT